MMNHSGPERPEIVVGLVATPPDHPARIAGQLCAELADRLAERVGGADVRWTVREGWGDVAPRRDGGADALLDDLARRRTDDGWDVAVCLTDLPLHTDRVPLVAQTSAERRVALVSLPALGLRQLRAVRTVVPDLVGRLLNDTSDQPVPPVDREPAELASRITAVHRVDGGERLHDFEEADPAHRHTSHLCALFPERQIAPRSTPELARAAEDTIERRQHAPGWEQTEWVEANFTVFYARLLDGDKALAHLRRLITAASEANLMVYAAGGIAGAAQNIYSFDGNAGGTAGIAEMLLQSNGEEIELLRALPSTWRNGEVRGLRARGGFTVDIAWRGGRLDHARIRSERTAAHRGRYGAETIDVAFGRDDVTVRPER
jgi:hypothetical protein